MRTAAQWREWFESLSNDDVYYPAYKSLEYMKELECQVVKQRHELSEAEQWIAEVERQLQVKRNEVAGLHRYILHLKELV